MFARGTAESKHKSNKNQDNEESHPGEQNQINEMMVERGEDLRHEEDLLFKRR